MTLEIVPEPSPEEREALERALAALPAPDGRDRGAWWRAGLEEALADPGDPDPAGYSSSS